MARPKKEGMDYFSHDTDAVNDEKIEAMRTLFGNDGYAFYFILLERVYRADGGELDVSSFTIKTVLIGKLGIGQERFEPMLNAAFDIGLFDRTAYEERKCITSPGIKKRWQEIEQQRNKWRKNKTVSDVNKVFSEDNTGYPDGKQTLSIGKSTQSKVKESKGNKKDINICVDSPAVESHDDGYHPDFERFWDVFPRMRRRDKAKAFATWKKKVKATEREDLIKCTLLYSQDANAIGKDGTFAKMPTSYLNAGTYKDYLENASSQNINSSGGSKRADEDDDYVPPEPPPMF